MAAWRKGERARAEAHVEQLAKDIAATIIYTRSSARWQAYPVERMAWVPVPTTPVRYMVALHELGHIGSKVARDRTATYGDLGVNALVEGAAWAWATMMAEPTLASRLDTEDWLHLLGMAATYWRWAATEPVPAVVPAI